jgi:hypothetical protein
MTAGCRRPEKAVKRVFFGIKYLPLIAVVILSCFYDPTAVQAKGLGVDRVGISAGYGTNFHPATRVQMAFLVPSVSHDFGNAWQGRLEAFIGTTLVPETRVALGLTPLAAYTLNGYGWSNWFVEGGVGLFYTDVRVPGFGSHWVFSPQAGIGWNFKIDFQRSFTLRLRYHHLSNAYLSRDNVSIDSLFFMVGMEFGK